MKHFYITIVLAFSFLPFSKAQKPEAVDTVFLNSLSTFSKKIEAAKETIWPDMKLGAYCIFRQDGPAFLINHSSPPEDAKLINNNIYLLKQSDYQLFGATQTLINGVLTAHNDYGQQFYSSINQFYAELFHELHHVYQRTYIKELKFDNPADLLTYPEYEKNFALKQYENTLLLEMLSDPPEKFKQNLDQFFTCRNRREEMIGSKYVDYEKGAESIEGPAMFCEYQFMKLSSSYADEEYIHHRYFYSLTEPFYSRNNLRGKCLLTGLAQCLILSKHFKNWESEYYSSGLFLYDYFIKKLSPHETTLPDITYDLAKAKYFTAIEKQKHSLNFQSFNKQPGIKLVLSFKEYPEFRGFDPMHAEAVNDSTIIHSTILSLGKAENIINIINYRVISVIADQIWFVKSVEIFVPEDSIRFEDNKLIVSMNSVVEMKWSFLNKVMNGNDYFITLE
jgi:hypothetical protein